MTLPPVPIQLSQELFSSTICRRFVYLSNSINIIPCPLPDEFKHGDAYPDILKLLEVET